MTDAVRIRGADRLARTLRAAADDVADQSALNAQAARDLADRMRQRAPRRTGALVGSIVASSGPDYVRAGSDLPYAGPQEYGSAPRHLPPHPYGRPALADEAPGYVNDLAAAIQADLGRVQGA